MTDAATMPTLRIKFEDAAGKALIPPLELRIPGALSLKTAKICALELVGKAIKTGADDALKSLGFK